MLSRCFYYKPSELRKILEGFKNLKDVMAAPRPFFLSLGIRGKTLVDFLENRNKNISLCKKGIEEDYKNIKIITIFDKEYPKNLKNIYDPPPILFYRGNLECLNEKSLAVVGSRKITDYGKYVCEMLVPELCRHFIIVSGLAYGVDGLAHEITVKNNQKTVAVLGSGIDEASIYPKTNINLAKRILDCGGLILSEVPPGIGPQKFHFPMRNRIISALAEGILIIEGGKKSGTLITAKLGLESGADIFAVPGSIFSPNSEGVNDLIKCGAHPITKPGDILEFYGISAENKKPYEPKNEREKIILEVLSGGEKHINELAEISGTEVTDLMDALTDLEIECAVKNIGGQRFVKI